MAYSQAQRKATEKWEKDNYDKILLRLPKGTKDKIKERNDSVNGYIANLIIKSLEE